MLEWLDWLVKPIFDLKFKSVSDTIGATRFSKFEFRIHLHISEFNYGFQTH